MFSYRARKKLLIFKNRSLNRFKIEFNKNKKPNEFKVSYFEGPKVEILGDYDASYFVEFIDSKTNQVIHSKPLQIICGVCVQENTIPIGLLKLMVKL